MKRSKFCTWLNLQIQYIYSDIVSVDSQYIYSDTVNLQIQYAVRDIQMTHCTIYVVRDIQMTHYNMYIQILQYVYSDSVSVALMCWVYTWLCVMDCPCFAAASIDDKDSAHKENSSMKWLRLVGSIKSQVSFAKEPYKRDDILQKRHNFMDPTVATPYLDNALHNTVLEESKMLSSWYLDNT